MMKPFRKKRHIFQFSLCSHQSITNLQKQTIKIQYQFITTSPSITQDEAPGNIFIEYLMVCRVVDNRIEKLPERSFFLSWVEVTSQEQFSKQLGYKLIQQSMAKVSITLIAALFAFSALSLIAAVALIAAIFGLNYSAFNFSTLAIACSRPYFTLTWIYVYLPLRAHTVTGLILLCLAVAAIVIAGKIYWPLKDLPSEAQQQSKLDRNLMVAIYIISSFQLLCAISSFGGKLSILINNGNCTVMQKTKLIILMVVSLLTFLLVLVQWILAVALDCSTQEQQPISMKDLQGNDVAREQDAISKHLEMQMKEYFSNNLNQKEEMMEGLLKREDQIYGQNTSPSPLTAAPSIPTSTVPPQSKTNNAAPQQKKKKGKKEGSKKRKNNAASMHSYHTMYNGQEEGYKYAEQNDQIDEQSDEDSQKQRIDEQLLHAKEDDNLSEKFEEKNFQLDYELDRAIKNDREQDLSPLQLRELMHLTKAAFALKGSDDKGLHLQRGYDNSEGFKIRVNFVKIKQHKETLRKQIQKLIDEPNPIEHTQSHEKQEKKIEVQEKPLSEETSKLLKVMLFNNSQFYKKPQDKQTECPIARYVQHDDGFQIIQSQKTDKHKKFEYSKQQLLFVKKRKDTNDDALREKGTLRQEFNESQFIKMERKAIFGDNWINEYDRKENKTDRNRHKRALVEVIRSKYYE